MANTNTISVKDALSILNIQSTTVTKEEIKEAYRKAAAKYHPDHNPAGMEMMKLVNIAYDILKDFEGQAPATVEKDYGEIINTALNAIIRLGLTIEICGVWIWVSGDTKTHREALKAAGYLWAPKKMLWYFRPEKYRSRNHGTWTMEQIRTTYGSKPVENEQKRIVSFH